MKNIFEETYTEITKLKKAYNETEREADREKARAAYHELLKPLEKFGSMAGRLWREYEISRDNGNDLLDINDTVWDKDVESLVSCMRGIGIERFTFSSAWSSAVETAWLFQQKGNQSLRRLRCLKEIRERGALTRMSRSRRRKRRAARHGLRMRQRRNGNGWQSSLNSLES